MQRNELNPGTNSSDYTTSLLLTLKVILKTDCGQCWFTRDDLIIFGIGTLSMELVVKEQEIIIYKGNTSGLENVQIS